MHEDQLKEAEDASTRKKIYGENDGNVFPAGEKGTRKREKQESYERRIGEKRRGEPCDTWWKTMK